MNWVLLENSLWVSGLTAAAAVVVGFGVALWLIGLPRPWQRRLLALALVAVALPPFLLVNTWLDLLGQQGRWRSWLPLNIYSLGGAVWVLTLWTWPLATGLIWAAWQRLEPEHLEVEPALSGWPLCRWVLGPMARLAAAQAAVVIFVLALNNFAVPTILQVKVFPAELWLRLNTGLDWKGAWTVSWPMVLAPALMLLWLRRRPIAWPQTSRTIPGPLLRRRLGPRIHTLLGVLAVLWWTVSAGLPLLELAASQRTWHELPGAFRASTDALWNSALYAGLTAVCCVGLAIAHRRLRGGAGWWVLFFLPGVLLGQALSGITNRPGLDFLYTTAALVVIALTVRYLALSRQAVGQAARGVDATLVDAARVDGARGWTLWRLVYWPRIAPAALAAGYVIYLLCLWDVETLLMIYPPGGETVALRIFNLLHYGHNVQVDALCLMLLALAAAPALVAGSGYWLRSRGRMFRLASSARWRAALGSGSVIGITLLGAVTLGGTAGCGPNNGPAELPGTERARVHSRFFDHVEVIGRRGTGSGEFIKPRSVAVDAEDNLYVVDMTGRVQKFSPQGEFLLSWRFPEIDRGKPKGMCWDRYADQLVVVEPHYARINHFTSDGRRVSRWGRSGTGPGEFGFPRAVAVDTQGRIFVSEYSRSERVQRFGPDHRFQLAFGHAGDGPGEFNRPEGLGLDRAGRLYVADSCNHRIQIFTPDGRWLRSFGAPGRGPGELSFPYDVRIDAAGYQFVCEFGNSRVQVFDPRHRPLESLGGPGARPGRFKNPWGLAFDSRGDLYVADSANHRVQKFIRTRPLAAVGTAREGARTRRGEPRVFREAPAS